MKHSIEEIQDAMLKYETEEVICCGDIFTKWNSTPELINFALQHLPSMFAVPGNHDLPEHSLEDINRSAYWTLKKAGEIENLEPGNPVSLSNDMRLWGFPEGLFPLAGISRHLDSSKINIAVVHDYCWTKGHAFPGSPKEKHVMEQAAKLHELGFTTGLFGDNHQGFESNYLGVKILNVGALMRRNSDEKDRKLQIGLLYEDGTVGTEEFDMVDFWEESILKLPPEDRKEIEELMEVLSELKAQTIDFGDALRQRLKRKPVSPLVKKILIRSISV